MQILREAVGSGKEPSVCASPAIPGAPRSPDPGRRRASRLHLPCGARAVLLELPRPPGRAGDSPGPRAARALRDSGAAAGRREEAPSPAPRSRPGAVALRLAERSRLSPHHRSALPGMELSPPRVPRGLKGRRAAVTAREVTCCPQGSAGVGASLEPDPASRGEGPRQGRWARASLAASARPPGLETVGTAKAGPWASGFELNSLQ